MTTGSTPTISATALLRLARRGLVEATTAVDPAERYAAAHLSALRAAAAVLAARARPVPARPATSSTGSPGSPSARASRPRSAWSLLAGVAPELAEWAAYFAGGAAKRAAAEAHVAGAVTDREADDLVRDAETFLAVVETTLGLPSPHLLLSR